MSWEDDVLTEYMGSGRRSDAYSDDVGDTFVFSQMRGAFTTPATHNVSCTLTRERTGEQLAFDLPAVIGRGHDATVKLAGNLCISRTHARMQESDDKIYLIDLGSTNGTSVRGQRIAAQAPVEVHDGDSICFGSEQFRLFVRN